MLEINATFIIAFFSFVIFVFIMNKILYKPIDKIITEREKFFKQNKEEQEFAVKKIQEIEDDVKNKIENTKKEANSYLKDFKDKTNKENIIKTKKIKEENKLEFIKNMETINSEKEIAKNNLKDKINVLSKEILESIINKKVENVDFSKEKIEETLSKYE